MGWHGLAITYYMWEKLDSRQFGTNKYNVCMDQVLEDGNKQDVFAVIALLKAALSVMIQDIPYIEEIILQSDNAATYQNHKLTLGLHLLNCMFKDKIFISGFVHSETQDGKTILDTHFGVCVRQITNFF